MALDDTPDQNDLERKRLLDAIRKRAEEAELKRIEDEEGKAPAQRAAAAPPAPSKPSLLEQKLGDLRDRLNIALDREKVDKAMELFEELKTLSKDDQELKAYEVRLLALGKEQERVKEERKVAQKIEARAPVRTPEEKKKIAELLELANHAYQYEQYDRASEKIEEILGLDPENMDALDLDERLQAARRFSEQIKREEAMRREEEEKIFPARREQEAPPPKEEKGEMWDSDVVVPEQDVFSAPVNKPPPAPPKQSLAERVVQAVQGIRIPKKALVTGAAVIVVGLLAYIVKDLVQSALLRPKPSLLVLPAEIRSEEQATGYIADGLTEGLIADCSMIPDLRVIAPVTTLRLKGSLDSPVMIARTLGAGFFVRWDVLRVPDGVRLDVELRDTLSPQPLWKSHIENSMRELPVAQRELVRAIVAKIGLDLPEDGEASKRSSSTSIPAAYDAYLRGRSFLVRGDSASVALAIGAFESAVQADPGFADGYTALAWAHLLVYDGGWDTSRIHVAKAASYLGQAGTLGARTSEKYRAQGLIEQFHNAFDDATQQLELAVTVAPSDAESQRRMSFLYLAKNNADQALTAAQAAVTDDPHNPSSSLALGLVQRFRGEYASALKTYEVCVPLAQNPATFLATTIPDLLVYTNQPDSAIRILDNQVARSRQSFEDYYALGRVYQIAGKSKQVWQRIFQRGIELVQEALRTNPDSAIPLTYLALMRTRLGEFRSADSAAARAARVGAGDSEVLYALARVYAVRRDKEKALQYLNSALMQRYCLDRVLEMDFYNLRSDPEFLQAITR